MISGFLVGNMLIMRVFHAILFFLYAFAISLKLNHKSELKLARSLWLLAVYGFAFGINEMISIVLLIKEGQLSPRILFVMWNLELILKAFAFMVMLWLGIRLVCDVYPKFRFLYRAGQIMSLLWSLMTFFTLVFRQDQLYIGVMDNLSRYMFAFPGLFLAGYGMLLHVREIEKFNIPSLVKHVRGLAYTFFVGVFLIGMIASHPVLWPAVILNRDTFMNVVNVPVIFFRSLYLVFTTYFVVNIVNIFEVEREDRLEQALKRQVLAEERDRIARELHDGIIQSIYGVGLNLKQYSILCEKKPSAAVKQLDRVKNDLDKIIVDIRDYIEELHLDDYSCISLKEAMGQLVNDFRSNAVMGVEFAVQGKQVDDLNIVQVNHILQIVRELLSNVAKHARATNVFVKLNFKEQGLEIYVTDNGIGFNPNELKLSQLAGESQGLNNIFHRVIMLQGAIVFHSAPGQGTNYEITFPYNKLSYLQSAIMKDADYFKANTSNEQ